MNLFKSYLSESSKAFLSNFFEDFLVIEEVSINSFKLNKKFFLISKAQLNLNFNVSIEWSLIDLVTVGECYCDLNITLNTLLWPSSSIFDNLRISV